MYKRASFVLTGLAALTFLFVSPGNSQAQHHPSGSHGGNSSHGSSFHGGNSYRGSIYHGGSVYHGGTVYHGGNYYHGSDGHHGDYDHHGYYGRYGLYGGLYAPFYYGLGYRNYGYSSYYYAPEYASTYYYPPSTTYVVPQTTYVVPETTIETTPALAPALGSADYDASFQPTPTTAIVEVIVPPSAVVWFDGLKTTQTGNTRFFKSPTLEPGKTYLYDIRARWAEGGQAIDLDKLVRVQAGKTSRIDFLSQ